MVWILLLAFIGVPALEIALFIQVGGWLGLWPTLGIVLLTAMAGTALLRQQGLAVLQSAQMQLDAGEMPLREIFDGLCLFFAGALLLTPGFFTDGVGFLLFLPPFRALLMATVAVKIMQNMRFHHVGPGGGPGPNPGPGGGFHPGGPSHGTGPGTGQRTGPGGGPVIDGDYEEVPAEPDGYLDPAKPNGDKKPQ